MWHAFFDEGATDTKHAAVAKEFEYPYASPLDELRAVDKALWVFFYLRILLQDMNIYIYIEPLGKSFEFTLVEDTIAI